MEIKTLNGDQNCNFLLKMPKDDRKCTKVKDYRKKTMSNQSEKKKIN